MTKAAFIIRKQEKLNDMKNNRLLAAAAIAASAASLFSCMKDDGISYSDVIPNAVVTVKPDGDKFFLQLDDSTVIYPSNMDKSPFGDKEVRAFLNYRIENEVKGEQTGYINWLRALLTKQTVESKGTDSDIENYGNDPIDLVNAFPTVCEDGYLTLRFRTVWGRFGSIQHEVNLITGVDPEDPYLVEFRHNAHGDLNEVVSDAYVAFRLDRLPDTKGKTVKLKVRYRTPSGDAKTVSFDYKTRPGDEK